MIARIKNCDVNYTTYGSSKNSPVVLLHGWGQNISMMDPLGQALKDDHYIIILDFPGFGESSEPEKAYTIDDYYECLKELLDTLKIKNPSIVGHSFGGRIAIKYASLNKIDKLVLLSSPFIKRVTKDSLKTKTLKTLKKIPFLKSFEEVAKKHIGSRDYRNASKVMRETLVNVVNTDLKEEASKIKAPTIVIAGTNDEEVSLDEINRYKDYISDCEIIIYEGLTHFAYIENLNRTIAILKAFFGGKHD